MRHYTANPGTQNGVALSTGTGPRPRFDEIRIGTNYADVTPAVAVFTNPLQHHVRSRLVGTNIVLTWSTTGGNTNVVQATTGSSGSYNTNGFYQYQHSAMIIAGSGGVTTNFVSTSAWGQPCRHAYYRIQQLPQQTGRIGSATVTRTGKRNNDNNASFTTR